MNLYNASDDGFTLIEIILVILIISILILFATPNFINQVSYANEIHISSDLMILESSIENYIGRNAGEGIDGYNSSLGKEYDEDRIYDLVKKEKLYDSNGLITMKDLVGMRKKDKGYGVYYKISGKFLGDIGDRSILKGTFLGQRVGDLDEVADHNNIRIRVIYLNK